MTVRRDAGKDCRDHIGAGQPRNDVAACFGGVRKEMINHPGRKKRMVGCGHQHRPGHRATHFKAARTLRLGDDSFSNKRISPEEIRPSNSGDMAEKTGRAAAHKESNR